MADLRVDYAVLDESERRLVGLHRQLAASGQASGLTDADWGSADLVGALAEFHGNWSYHRQQILGRMRALGEMTRQSRQSFQVADTVLARELAKT
jgi:hypothetical protein